MLRTKRGFYCAVKGCTSVPKGSTSFFSLPKDENRRLEWINACNRPELHEKDEKFLSQTRVCAKHFEKPMFLNDLKNRLQPHAKPVLFLSSLPIILNRASPSSADSHDVEHIYSMIKIEDCAYTPLPPQTDDKIRNPTSMLFSILTNKKTSSYASAESPPMIKMKNNASTSLPVQTDIKVENPASTLFSTQTDKTFPSYPSANILLLKIGNHASTSPPVQINNKIGNCASASPSMRTSKRIGNRTFISNCTQTEKNVGNMTTTSTQTGKRLYKSLLSNSRVKRNLKQQLRRLKELNKRLKMKHDKSAEDLTIKDFKQLCYKFLPPSTANLVQSQVTLNNQTHTGKRYSDEYKTFASQLYLISPKAYKFTSKYFTLPNVRSIQRFTHTKIIN